MHSSSEPAFAAYFTARRDAVRARAYVLTGDWAQADDVAQTTFVQLYRHWESLRDHDTWAVLDAWTRRVVVRAVVDERRRPWRRERPTEVLPERAAATAEPGDVLGERERVLAGLQRVPARQRAVLVLRFLEDQDVAATARALGCSEGTVKSQSARGLATLRAALDEPQEVRGGRA